MAASFHRARIGPDASAPVATPELIIRDPRFNDTPGWSHVVVLERDLAGQGASSRAAGVVRAQGGTPVTVALGRFSIAFYRSHQDRLGGIVNVPSVPRLFA